MLVSMENFGKCVCEPDGDRQMGQLHSKYRVMQPMYRLQANFGRLPHFCKR